MYASYSGLVYAGRVREGMYLNSECSTCSQVWNRCVRLALGVC